MSSWGRFGHNPKAGWGFAQYHSVSLKKVTIIVWSTLILVYLNASSSLSGPITNDENTTVSSIVVRLFVGTSWILSKLIKIIWNVDQTKLGQVGVGSNIIPLALMRFMYDICMYDILYECITVDLMIRRTSIPMRKMMESISITCKFIGYIPIFRQPNIPTAHYSDTPIFRHFKTHYSDNYACMYYVCINSLTSDMTYNSNPNNNLVWP